MIVPDVFDESSHSDNYIYRYIMHRIALFGWGFDLIFECILSSITAMCMHYLIRLHTCLCRHLNDLQVHSLNCYTLVLFDQVL